MPLRSGQLLGPRTPEPRDIDALNEIFALSFTDRYRRDGLVGVRVPKLNRDIWNYALRDAGPGAMVWHDEDGQIVAFNIAHRSGVEGWMGPLAVRPERQGAGIGTIIVNEALTWLRTQGAKTIGLETMPRTVDNIGFYSRLGFLPGPLTVTLVGEVRSGPLAQGILMSELSPGDRDTLLEACRDLVDRSAPGYDFTREFELTQELGIGDTVVIESGEVRGFALWHSAALVEERVPEELRLLKLFADSAQTFERLTEVLEGCAVSAGLRRVAMRCQTASTSAYAALVGCGYRVRWTDLRMTLAGHPEARVGPEEVLFSNWEI